MDVGMVDKRYTWTKVPSVWSGGKCTVILVFFFAIRRPKCVYRVLKRDSVYIIKKPMTELSKHGSNFES